MFGGNTGKYITFSVPVKKELDNGKTIKYKLKFIDSFRFMSTLLAFLLIIFLMDFIMINAYQYNDKVHINCVKKILIGLFCC